MDTVEIDTVEMDTVEIDTVEIKIESKKKREKTETKYHALINGFKKDWSLIQLDFRSKHNDLIELREWINGLSDDDIYNNSIIASKITNCDYTYCWY